MSRPSPRRRCCCRRRRPSSPNTFSDAFSRIWQVLRMTMSASASILGRRIAERRQDIRHAGGVVDVHLAAIGLDEEFLGQIGQGVRSAARATRFAPNMLNEYEWGPSLAFAAPPVNRLPRSFLQDFILYINGLSICRESPDRLRRRPPAGNGRSAPCASRSGRMAPPGGIRPGSSASPGWPASTRWPNRSMSPYQANSGRKPWPTGNPLSLT